MRVLELSTDIGGAYCGWLFASLGAEVARVAIEDRTWRSSGSPIALGLAYLAQGKRTCDVREIDPSSYDVLVADSEELLHEVTGETPASLSQRHPRLVVGVCSTFGLTGPNAEVPAVALDAQAVSAVAWALGEPDREPLSLPVGVLEHQSGANLAANVSRMIFARIPGVNVWEMDGAGTQVNIGTRGTDTHRSIEMNMRQNGYNTNSDMFGYPEDHYTPPMQAISEIQYVRGSAARGVLIYQKAL